MISNPVNVFCKTQDPPISTPECREFMMSNPALWMLGAKTQDLPTSAGWILHCLHVLALKRELQLDRLTEVGMWMWRIYKQSWLIMLVFPGLHGWTRRGIHEVVWSPNWICELTRIHSCVNAAVFRDSPETWAAAWVSCFRVDSSILHKLAQKLLPQLLNFIALPQVTWRLWHVSFVDIMGLG